MYLFGLRAAHLLHHHPHFLRLKQLLRDKRQTCQKSHPLRNNLSACDMTEAEMQVFRLMSTVKQLKTAFPT